MQHENIVIGQSTLPLVRVQTIVVGSGAAGLNAAVSLFSEGRRDIALLTEAKFAGTSHNTGSDKQTYYRLSTCGSEPDSVRKMARTLFDGQSMDGDIALSEAALSLRCFFHLVQIGVPFPYNQAGEYVGYKTDHDPNQRGTSAGPLTSKLMTEALWQELERYRIPVFDGYQVIELLTEQEQQATRVRGLLALKKKRGESQQEYVVFSADNIVYAVGGEAGLYATSVYPASQVGSMGAAFRVGARGKNLTESQYGMASVKFRWNLSGTYQQVLPRYISTRRDGTDEREFLSEAFSSRQALLQAIFLKGYQWPFDPRKARHEGSSLIDLLVFQETVLKGRRVFLDYRQNPSGSETNGQFDPLLLSQEAYQYLKQSDGLGETPVERLEHMNPAAIALYRAHHIDLYTEPLEIAVCAQHNNGGLAGNGWWESNIRHLFPVGEVNGSHGVYRLGGSALNSGQVGSLRAAQYIAHCYNDEPWTAEQMANRCADQIEKAIGVGRRALDGSHAEMLDLLQERKAMQVRMSRYGAHIRSREGVAAALAENALQQKRLMAGGIKRPDDLKSYYRLRDSLVSQQVYLEAIADYIAQGGTSRGSYLIADEHGEKPHPTLPESFRYSLEDRGLGEQIQEIEYRDGVCQTTWRQVRPIPEEDNWFEKVWREYRENAHYRA